MVKIASSLALLVGSAAASQKSLNRLISAIEKQRANATRNRGPSARNLPGESGSFADYLKPYGCWCNFAEDSESNMLTYGRGEPIDEWDSLCKQLQQQYECASIDAEVRGETCNPWEVDFSLDDWQTSETASKYHFGIDPWAWTVAPVDDVMQFGVTDPLWRCRVIDNKCQTDVCIAEYWFLVGAWSLVLKHEPDYNIASQAPELIEHHMTVNGFLEDGFDRETMCPAKNVANGQGNGNGAGRAARSCCGNWPRRFSYKTESGSGATRECCEKNEQARDFNNNFYNVGTGKVFDSNILTCCADGSLGAQGSQC